MFPVETPASRSSDPASSHLAEAEITSSGERARQQAICAEAVRQYPGRTSKELSVCARVDRYMLARQLPECALAGAVKRGDLRTCTASKRQAVTWWPPLAEMQTDLFPSAPGGATA